MSCDIFITKCDKAPTQNCYLVQWCFIEGLLLEARGQDLDTPCKLETETVCVWQTSEMTLTQLYPSLQSCPIVNRNISKLIYGYLRY